MHVYDVGIVSASDVDVDMTCFCDRTDGSIRTCRTNQEVAAVAETATAGELTEFSELAQAKVLAIVGAGSISPFDGNSWEDVMQHMVQTSCLTSR